MSEGDSSSPSEYSPRPSNPFVQFQSEEIEQTIHARFEKQAARVPASLAVKTREDRLTYDALNRLANRIAHTLLAARGENEEPVAIMLEQSALLIAVILGVLKAGKIYVPIDPTNPPARIALVLDEAETSCIVTDDRNAALATKFAGKGRMVFNASNLNAGVPDTNPLLPIPPDAFAYIFYTSGSTGKQKGVVDAHRNVLHNIMRYTNNLHIAEDDRLTLLQSCSFSGSVSSLFCALLNGATVYPYDIPSRGLGNALGSWLNDEQITIYHSVPTIFRTFLQGDALFASVRIIRLEGDAASNLDVALYRKHFASHCLLVNGLGATETGIARQYFIDHHAKLTTSIVPIGYPVEDVTIKVVSEEGEELPRGEIGEIFAQSKYLAVGYWRNPELTAKAFMMDSQDNRLRSYRTGDMGCMRDDGCLEYFGRKDFQLKIHGHRVEAAEVESALLEIPSVREAVVTTRTDHAGEPQLVAYLVLRDGARKEDILWRNMLKEQLPDYMIPSRFVPIDAMPLNVNLKVDRRLLPDPGALQREDTLTIIDPRDEVEAAIRDVWQRELNIQPISVDDNFFELRGDSLIAARVIVSLEQRFKRNISPGTFLEAPTIRQFAETLRNAKAERKKSSLVALQPKGLEPPLFAVHAHAGNVLQYQALAEYLGNDYPFYGLQSVGLAQDEQPLITIESMAERYIAEIKTIQPSGPYCIAGFCFGGVIALEMAHQLSDAGDRIALLAMFDMNPAEVPRLLSAEAQTRYRLYLAARKRERRLKKFKGSIAEAARYVCKGALLLIAKKFKRFIWNIWHLQSSGANKPLPRFLWDVELGNEHAFQLYAPRSFPGRVTLFLSEETTSAYTEKPAKTWEGIGANVDVILVPGEEGAMLRRPHVEALVQNLRRALENSSRL